MDVALKQRLVGASVLVVLGVILIPMVLEGPPDSRSATTIPIPEQPERGFETRLLPVNSPDAEQPPRAAPEEGPGEVVSVGTGGGAQPVEAARALTAGPEAPRQEVAEARWILQLGSFGNAANAARLVQAVKEAGWNAYQEKVTVAGNTLYRVRAGAWPSKEAAADEGTRIGARFKDLDVSVRPLGAADAPAASALSGWMVQVGSFAQETNAYQLRDQLRAGGITAHVLAVAADTGGGFKVRAGPELDRAGAERLRERLRTEFDLNGIIVNHP